MKAERTKETVEQKKGLRRRDRTTTAEDSDDVKSSCFTVDLTRRAMRPSILSHPLQITFSASRCRRTCVGHQLAETVVARSSLKRAIAS